MSQRVYWELGVVVDRSGNLYRITSNHARARREMGHCELWGVVTQYTLAPFNYTTFKCEGITYRAYFVEAGMRANRFCHVDWRAKDKGDRSVLDCLVTVQRWLRKWTAIRKQRVRAALALVLRSKMGECLGRDVMAVVMSRL